MDDNPDPMVVHRSDKDIAAILFTSETTGRSRGAMLSHGERKAGNVGYTLPGVNVRIADENVKPVPAGEVEVLELSGETVFQDYWQMPDKRQKIYALMSGSSREISR